MKNFWSVIILVVVLLGLGLYFSSYTDTANPIENPTATSSATIIATSTRTHIEDKENKFTADIENPMISGHISAEAFNRLAKVYVDRATEQFAQSAAEANFNIPDVFKDQNHGFIAEAETSIVADRYVSVLFTREYSMLAAAHPFHMTETFVYDLEPGKVMELSHIFKNTDTAVAYIAVKSAEQVKAHLKTFDAEESFIEQGVAPEEANFRNYTISETGITFYFAEYQVAPYAAGPQKAMFTWIELDPLLTDQFRILAN